MKNVMKHAILTPIILSIVMFMPAISRAGNVDMHGTISITVPMVIDAETGVGTVEPIFKGQINGYDGSFDIMVVDKSIISQRLDNLSYLTVAQKQSYQGCAGEWAENQTTVTKKRISRRNYCILSTNDAAMGSRFLIKTYSTPYFGNSVLVITLRIRTKNCTAFATSSAEAAACEIRMKNFQQNTITKLERQVLPTLKVKS